MSVLVEDITAAQQGDIKAFERLVNGSKSTVISIALSIVKDIDSSEDVAQQIYINCWKNLHTLKSATSFLPWLRQSTRYMAFNYLRDNKVSLKAGEIEAEQVFSEFCTEPESNEKALSHEQYRTIVSQILDHLPDESREVVLLYYREQQSTTHVAKLLGISDASVRKKLSRSRTLLKQHVLDKFGKVLLSTAPTIAFTSIVISSAVVTPSAAASVGSASSIGSSVNSSWISKLAALLGGAMLGALAGAVAVFWSHKMAQKQILDDKLKRQLLLLRNITLVWLMVFGVLFGLSYSLTSSAWGPIATYSMFALGLFVLIKRSQLIIMLGMEQNPAIDSSSKAYKLQKLCGTIGLYGGVVVGFIGMLLGLVGSGRL